LYNPQKDSCINADADAKANANANANNRDSIKEFDMPN
jgi:hypothetical protein